MITYKNISNSKKTFYGITFLPKDVKEVPGYINATGMIKVGNVDDVKQQVQKKRGTRKPATDEVKSIKAESKLLDQASTNETLNINKEELTDGEHQG